MRCADAHKILGRIFRRQPHACPSAQATAGLWVKRSLRDKHARIFYAML
jgi:hypothetical protein